MLVLMILDRSAHAHFIACARLSDDFGFSCQAIFSSLWFSLAYSISYLLFYGTELRARRNPLPVNMVDGLPLMRYATRLSPAALSQPPPRATRVEPDDGPRGLTPPAYGVP
jgi:hypothetical protein